VDLLAARIQDLTTYRVVLFCRVWQSILQRPKIEPATDLASKFLKAAAGQRKDADDFFNDQPYRKFLGDRLYSSALQSGISLLEQLEKLDSAAYKKIHKGTPFYWLGMAAFSVRDFQSATFFFNAAVSQDIEFGRDPVADTPPAFKFIQIQGEPTD
jgi:hypothetical protein